MMLIVLEASGPNTFVLPVRFNASKYRRLAPGFVLAINVSMLGNTV